MNKQEQEKTMKKCPFCAEGIQDDAIVCRYCGHRIPKSPKKTVEGKLNKYNKLILILGTFFIAALAFFGLSIYFLISQINLSSILSIPKEQMPNTPAQKNIPLPSLTPTLWQTIVSIRPTAEPTLVPTFMNTPTETPIPTETLTPAPTLNPLFEVHGPGVYLVNTDIAPGIWRSQGEGDECYWMRSDKRGEIIDNYYGFAGGTIYIAPSDFSVEMWEKCGNWIYLSPP